MKRETFVLSTDLYDKTISLSDDELGKLIRKILLYVSNKELPLLEDKLELVFDFIKFDLDKNFKKYEERCKQNLENGKKGGAPKGNHNAQKQPKQPKTTETTENNMMHHNHNHYHNQEEDKKNNRGMGEEEKEEETTIDEEFEQLWTIYPNKKGKVIAMQKYSLARKQGATYTEVRQGLEHYIKYCKTIDKKFIKHGSTWFSQRCWSDEYTDENDSAELFNDHDVSEMTISEKEELDELLNDLS